MGIRLLVTKFLVVSLVIVTGATASVAAQRPAVEAESFALPPWAGTQVSDSSADARKALLIWSNATASKTVVTTAANNVLKVRAKAQLCNGAPSMQLLVDGTTSKSFSVTDTRWQDYTTPVTLAPGNHSVSIAFTNDTFAPPCDRNLLVDSISLENDTPAYPKQLDVEPNTAAVNQQAQWKRDNWQEGARLLDKITSQPQATWFGGWSGNITSAVQARVNAAASRGAMPVLVAYNIPSRDCGGYSAGGSSDYAAYQAWIDGFAAGLNNYPTVVILEPDALAQVDCLNNANAAARYELLQYAGQKLTTAGATVYIDAGHAGWKPANEMANRLKAAGVDRVRGFSLNVSNFGKTADQINYGKAITAKTSGDTSFVIDTGRNGKATNGRQWCNPWGQALGEKPSTATGIDTVDAYLWIKRPGESDGTCNGGPSAGNWWLNYAMDLARNATWQ